MANTHDTLTGLFSDIADSIRGKTGQSGTIVADNFPTAIDGITTPVLQSKSATPSLSTQTITPDSPNNGLSSVSVSAVTKELLATLDADFVAENIKKDVDLFGLIGTLGGGDILGHKYVAGSFTLASDVSSAYTVLDKNDLFNAIKDDFPGATNFSDYFYTRSGDGVSNLFRFLAGICWLDEIDNTSTNLNTKEWIASFIPRYSLNTYNNSLLYSDNYRNFAARSGGRDGLVIDNDGAIIGFSSNYQGYAGRRYKYLIYALDHGAKL